jgi:hypothetical protein
MVFKDILLLLNFIVPNIVAVTLYVNKFFYQPHSYKHVRATARQARQKLQHDPCP